MTNEKVIKTLSGAYDLLLQCHVRFEFMSDFKEALQMARGALEKQTPKKPKIKNTQYVTGDFSYTFNCPVCDGFVGDEYDEEDCVYKYCFECGQAIDWSEVW